MQLDLGIMTSLVSSLLSCDNNIILIFDSGYGVIICKICQYALVPPKVASHLRNKHRQDEGSASAQSAAIARNCLIEMVYQIAKDHY